MHFTQIFSIFHSWFLGNASDIDFPGCDTGDRYRTPCSFGWNKHVWFCFILYLWNYLEWFTKDNYWRSRWISNHAHILFSRFSIFKNSWKTKASRNRWGRFWIRRCWFWFDFRIAHWLAFNCRSHFYFISCIWSILISLILRITIIKTISRIFQRPTFHAISDPWSNSDFLFVKFFRILAEDRVSQAISGEN